METQIVNNKLLAKRSDLHNWEGNLNVISSDNFQKLLQARRDYVDTEPFLVMPDGTILAGNHRNLADEKYNVEWEWVELIDFAQLEDGRWYVIQDGEVQRGKRSFETREKAMLAYCLLKNSKYAGISVDKLANITSFPEYDDLLTELNAVVGDPKSIQEFINKVASEPTPEVPTPPVEGDSTETHPTEEAPPAVPETPPVPEPVEPEEAAVFAEIPAKCPDCGCKHWVKLTKEDVDKLRKE